MNARRPAILAATRPYRWRVGIFRAYDSVDFWIKVSVSEAGPRKICRASHGYKEICYGEAKMTRTLILITLLMAPFAVQALGQADSVSFRTVVATAGSCALPACTRKKWAKPAWATVAATGQRAQLLSSSLAWV